MAQLTGDSVEWVRMLVWRSNMRGADGLRDERHTNPGRPPLLTPQQQAGLDQAMDGPAPDGGLWSSPKVAAWMRDRLGRRVSKQRGWVYLRRLQRRPKVPRPRHAQADAQEQEDFGKKLPEQLAAIQQAHPQARVELWAMDEHRIGLKPIVRKVWAKRGKQPIAMVRPQYQWMYVNAFVQPLTGQTEWQLCRRSTRTSSVKS